MRRWGVFFLFLSLIVSSSLFAQDKNEITFTVDFSPLKITPQGEYYSLYMKDTWNRGAVGEPVIPVKTVKLLIPYGKNEDKVTVELGDKITIQGSYLLEPGQKPVPLSYKGPVKIALPNAAVYASENSYPSKIYCEPVVQFKNGSRILVINLYPVHYIPSEGRVSYYKNMTVHVSFAPENKTLDLSKSLKWRGTQSDIRDIKNLVDNPEAIETYPSSRSLGCSVGSLGVGAGDFKYVIITTAALAGAIDGPNNDFPELIVAKIARGITAKIVTTAEIYADAGYHPVGDEDEAEQIRNFIKDAHTTWSTEYVLLGGDADGVDTGPLYGVDESEVAIVPARGLWAMDVDYDEGDNIPSDMYYSCLDGTFDANGNGIYGEYFGADDPDDDNNPSGGDPLDFFADVYVGRACVDSAEEVSNFVGKTLRYETTTDSYLGRAYMVGEWLNSYPLTYGGNYKDEVKAATSTANSYTTNGFGKASNVLTTQTLYDRDYLGYDWSNTEIIDIINDNVHLINHLGHGDNMLCMKMDNWQPFTSDVDDLINTEFFIGYSQACYSGAFDNWYSEYDYIPWDCILEHFTTKAHGAVAFVGNSRYGWYNPGGTNGASQKFDREFWDALFGENISNLGKMNSDSKDDNAGYMIDPVMGDYGRWCAYELNLFGDPELQVRLMSSKGVIWFDEDYYTTSSLAEIVLLDSDLNQDIGSLDTVDVEVTSLAEPTGETVRLTETGNSTGWFTGSIQLGEAGVLEVSDNDTITVTYIDTNDGTGSLAIVTDTALVILSLEAPTGLTAAVVGNHVILQWNSISSSILDGYNVYRSTSLDRDYVRLNTIGLIYESPFEDVRLIAGRNYYYVTAEDTFGNETTPSNIVTVTITGGTTPTGGDESGDGGGGSGPGSLSGCFIATACYGTPMAKEVRVLSQFRNEYLLTNSLGSSFVSAYYRVSPQIASFISEHPYLKSIVRWCLKPVVEATGEIVEK